MVLPLAVPMVTGAYGHLPLVQAACALHAIAPRRRGQATGLWRCEDRGSEAVGDQGRAATAVVRVTDG